MISRQEFLKQLRFFNFEKNSASQQEAPPEQQNNRMEHHEDVNKLETLICIESLLASCYQSLAWSVHNQTVRRECQHFEQHAMYHQEELIKNFPLNPESKVVIESKVNQYLLQFKPSYLSLREVINLTINLNSIKMEIYKYLFHTVREHQKILNSFLEDNAEEMHFLRQEKNFHQNRLDTYLKV